MQLRFSKANAKIKALENVDGIKPYLAGKRKVYSFDLLSGHNCPYAKNCLSKAVTQPDGRRKIVDGPDMQFRCFSASQEVLFPALYKLREGNTEVLKIGKVSDVADALENAMPKNAGVIRIHVGGDFTTRRYFEGWLELAKRREDVLFYAYTKSLPFWVKLENKLENVSNFVLTASYGGHKDSLIVEHNLRNVVVVKSEAEAATLKLAIDHDDSHAADPSKRGESFALLIHGPQAAGSDWGAAVRNLKGVGSYKR